MLALHGRPRAPAEIADWKNANGKEDETYQGKLPVHPEQGDHGAENSDGLLENVAAHAGQRLLHVAGVIDDARHQESNLHPIKEIHRVAHDLGKKLVANIIHHLVADPVHEIGTAVGNEAPGCHHQRNSEANPNDGIDLRTDV